MSALEKIAMQDHPGWLSLLPLLDFIDRDVSIHSKDGAIVHVNRKLRRTGSGSAGEFLGRSCDEVFPTDTCPYEEAFARKQAVEIESGHEPGQVPIRVTVVPLLGDREEPEGFVRIAGPTGTCEPSQEALLRAERFATLGQMMAGIAHDVGTPLNIISGYAEYLLMRTRANEAGHKELTAILEQTRRVADYIRIMLDLSRPSHGTADAIELKGFMSDSIDLMGSHLRKLSVRASLRCTIASPVIYADSARLRQAFFSLIVNAGKRVGPGGQLELVIEQFLDMPEFVSVLLSVSDREGRGMDCSAAFAGFLTEPSLGSGWGATETTTDTGLALAKAILDECGATVAPITVADRGVALVVYLPKITGRRTMPAVPGN